MSAWAAALGRPRQAATEFIDRRLPNLLAKRRDEVLPVTLHQRRIYIVPSGFGFAFAIMMLAILAGALNYNNNGAMLYGLLPVSLALISMLQTFRNLDRLAVVHVAADPVHAGEWMSVEVHLRASDARPRFGIELRLGDSRCVVDMRSGETGVARLQCRAVQRGLQSLQPIRISCIWPFGLFFAWSYVHPAFRALVYPRPEAGTPSLPEALDRAKSSGQSLGEDELRSLRDWQIGDPTRLIAWKASARRDELLVRQLESPRSRNLLFDYAELAGLDPEARLSRLTRWILMAEQQGHQYQLRLPGWLSARGSGSDQRHQCLRSLALHGIASA